MMQDVSYAAQTSKFRPGTTLKYDMDNVSKLVFPRITAVVRAQPRSTNSKFPSWHEKMLLYDPIVLEDFTAWLNRQGVRVLRPAKPKKTRGKGRVGEVGRPGDGRRLGDEDEARMERDDAEVEAERVHVPLEVWMVQKWCESMSVCCLRREGDRGGPRVGY